jgi:hypothetical protein
MKKMKIKISQKILSINSIISFGIAFVMLYFGFVFAFVVLSGLFFINVFVFFKRRYETLTFAFIILIYAVFFLFFESFGISKRIYLKGGYITPAVVVEKRIHSRMGPTIRYEFFEENKLHENFALINITNYKQINEGDTILAVYVKDSKYYNYSKVYKLHPTKEAIKKFREDVYYKKRGKIYKE